MSSLVVIEKEDLLVSSWDLSQGFCVPHRAILRLLKKYNQEFETFGLVTTALPYVRRKKMGPPIQEQFLNEGQAMYLTTLLTNNDTVRKFKMHLTGEFLRQRKLLMQLINNKRNEDWIESRAQNKFQRKETTDVIKLFVDYAQKQGSQNAEQYYCNITKMENQSLVPLEFLQQKFPNLREVVDRYTLDRLKMCDEIIAQALVDGMQKELYYKEIYKLARERVEIYAELFSSKVRQKLEDSKAEIRERIARKKSDV